MTEDERKLLMTVARVLRRQLEDVPRNPHPRRDREDLDMLRVAMAPFEPSPVYDPRSH